MAEETQNTFRYRIVRYTPNIVRDEWLNIGVLLEDTAGPRWAIQIIQEDAEFARVRRLHPNADLQMLRALHAEFEARLEGPLPQVESELNRLDTTLSNVIQFSPVKGLLASDFDAEMERLYHEHVAPPPSARGGILESTRAWIKKRLDDVFRRRRVPGLQRSVSAAEFTEPGDPLKLDYGYHNGVRGYIHSVALGREPSLPKVLAYTAGRVRRRYADSEFTAVTETEIVPGNRRHEFIARLFQENAITIVPLNRVERFAEDLRVRLQ
jgi:Protein of unknown function (DUF3037)